MNKEILLKNRIDWRSWLAENHNRTKEIWLIYYKKHAKKKSVKQREAVEEALCYGWIDSIVKRIDDERYMQKFTPRKENSIWSDLNKKRVKELITNGKMTKYGIRKINLAKKNGMWNKIHNTTNLDYIPKEFKNEFSKNITLRNNWNRLSPSYKKQYLYWINSAKREETKEKRISKSIALILNNEKLGMV